MISSVEWTSHAVTLFRGAQQTTPMEQTTLGVVLDRIKQGTYAREVAALRQIYASGNEGAYRRGKERLPAVTPCCALQSRAQKIPWSEKLLSTTGVVHLDLDHLDDPAAVRTQLAKNPHIVFAFISPSGTGVKVGIAAEGIEGPESYRAAWRRVTEGWHQAYPALPWSEDPAVKYLHALCFVSHDPALYVNAAARPFRPPAQEHPRRQPTHHGSGHDYERTRTALDAIPNPGADYDTWLTIGMALHSSGESWARHAWDEWSGRSDKYDARKQESSWRSFTPTGAVTLGSVFYLAQAHGWHPPRGADIPRNGHRPSGTEPTPDTTPEETVDPFVFTDVRSILASPVVPRRWLIPGIIADGLTILGGSPKGGKTYLAYALALAVAQYGRWCQHWPVEQGKVIYITLEDDPNDTHLRLLELDPTLQVDAGRLLFVHGQESIPTFGNGLREWLEETLQLHQPRLLIIDPISYLYVLKKTGSQFEETKDMLFPLQWLGKTYQCAIVCLDHRRKRSREDVSMVDTLYGSVAKQAVPSGIIMVNRDQDDIELDMTIRNGQQQKEYVSFTFDNGRCFLTYKGGEQEPMNQSDRRIKLLSALREAVLPLSIPDLLAVLKLPDTRQERVLLGQMLYRCMKAREVEKTSRGRYVLSTDDD